MNTEDEKNTSTEDRVAEGLLDRLNSGIIPSSSPSADEMDSLVDQYTELLGLIPYGLEPMAPAMGAKNRLMESIRGNQPVARSRTEVADVAPPPGWVRQVLPLAASISIVLLGIVGWQSFELAEQGGEIVELTERLSHVNIERTAEVAEFERNLQRMQSQLSLVTSKGVEVCTLQPQIAEAAATGARGTLFVSSDHQHWYLRIDDLEPCPQGRAYQLWFVMADGTAVDGGILEIKHDTELEVTSDTMPAGSVAVQITLEPAGGSDSPSGPSILYGDEVMRIL